MTVLNLKPRLIWDGDGNTSSVALTVDGVPLTYRDSSYIRVRQLIVATNAESDLVEGVDYNFGLGTINRIAGNLPSGYKWAIWREQPRAQEVALLTGGDLASSDVEDLGNISVEQIQEMQDAIDRAFKLSVFAETDISNELPAPAASNLIAWNAAANALVNVLPADVSIVTLISAFMQTVIQAADAAAVRTLIEASPDPLSVLRVTSAITPTEIDADQDDYAPTGHASAFLFRLSSDATWSITGLAGGTVGRIVMLANVGSNPILIPNEDNGSAAANRFAIGGEGPIYIAAGETASFQYDNTSARWRPFHSADMRNEVSNVPIGGVIAWMTGTAPSGFLECDGAAVSRATYAALFAVISDDYGPGDGSTTFNLPDLRGEFLRGWDHGEGNDPDAGTRTNRGDGTTGDNVGTKQADAFEAHSHTMSGNYAPDGSGAGSPNNFMRDDANAGAYSDTNEIQSTGGNETRPRNVNVMFIIRAF